MIGLFLLLFLLLVVAWYKIETMAYLIFYATVLLGILVFWHHLTAVIDINL